MTDKGVYYLRGYYMLQKVISDINNRVRWSNRYPSGKKILILLMEKICLI